MMNISITKKEYGTLLDMLCIADWVLNLYTTKAPKQNEYDALKQKFLSYFKEMDASDKIEFSSELNEYFEKIEYEQSLNDNFIQPFENMLFWDELTQRLGERDMIQKIGMEQYKKMNPIERLKKVEEFKEHYARQFEKHGLEHLKIDA
ncbi:hypothetical protein [Legionella cherrii]|uniref:Uncharacterized protein n=1 Tax=Legionella cherrii TaxID=28084 RepID=A0A0W0S800_9GAMM|nr:hypothetical protein [Legionella cherrii]KTC79424.1 hypothetical protein Lche_1444 [Legionella cherrii]VEB37231.1 Uncharacterised protein [Legionella cherrii]